MTVDMLTATFFWPEGTLLHIREDLSSDGADDPPANLTAAPLHEPQGETFWARVLRQIGWAVLPKAATSG